ncbi:hypothetical protein Ddc_18171 [Ditylenchus destructor]|nr:hypothetical protein Ddc_18171 [Ditylenchus destructor]
MSSLPLEQCDSCHQSGHLTVDCPKAKSNMPIRTKSEGSSSKRAEDPSGHKEIRMFSRLTTIKNLLRPSSTNDLIKSGTLGETPMGRYSAKLEETAIEEISKNRPTAGNIEEQKTIKTEEYFECADGGIDGKPGEEVTEQIIKVNIVTRGESPTGKKCKCCRWFGKSKKDKAKK